MVFLPVNKVEKIYSVVKAVKALFSIIASGPNKTRHAARRCRRPQKMEDILHEWGFEKYLEVFIGKCFVLF